MSDAIQAAIRDLLSGRPDRQERADRTLHRLVADPAESDSLVEQLLPLADHGSSQVRLVALQAVAAARGALALPLLEAHACDADSEVRAAIEDAAEALGEPARPLLTRFLGDEELVVRFWAATALAEVGDGAALAVLIEGLAHSSTRFEALHALRVLGDPRCEAPVREILRKGSLAPTERVAAAGVLARLGDAGGRSVLVEEASKRRSEGRGLAIELVAELGIAQAAPSLEAALHDRGDPFRGAAAVALGRLKIERAAAQLGSIVGDEGDDSDVRAQAVEGLATLGTEVARTALREAAPRVRDAEIRSAIDDALEGVSEEEGARKDGRAG